MQIQYTLACNLHKRLIRLCAALVLALSAGNPGVGLAALPQPTPTPCPPSCMDCGDVCPTEGCVDEWGQQVPCPPNPYVNMPHMKSLTAVFNTNSSTSPSLPFKPVLRYSALEYPIPWLHVYEWQNLGTRPNANLQVVPGNIPLACRFFRVNGKPAMRFTGYTSMYTNNDPLLPLKQSGSGEVFVVARSEKLAYDSSEVRPRLWNFGDGRVMQYPSYTMPMPPFGGRNCVTDIFASAETARLTPFNLSYGGVPRPTVDRFHCYSAAGNKDLWASWVNAHPRVSETSNAVKGSFGNYFVLGNNNLDAIAMASPGFRGEVAEFLLFDRVLSAQDRTKVFIGIAYDYGIGDANRNGLIDAWEIQHFGSLTGPNSYLADSDISGSMAQPDGLLNYEEQAAGTNPFSADTDGDGWTDGAEIKIYNTDPLTFNVEAAIVILTPRYGTLR